MVLVPALMAVFMTVLHRLMVSGSDRAAKKWQQGYAIDGIEGDLERWGDRTDGDRDAAGAEVVADFDSAGQFGIAEKALNFPLGGRIAFLHLGGILQRIIAASPSGVMALDLDGRITMANPSAAQLLRRESAELQGHRLEDLGSPLADRLAALADGESRLISLQGRRRIRCPKSIFERGRSGCPRSVSRRSCATTSVCP